MEIEIIDDQQLQKVYILENLFRNISQDMHYLFDAPMLLGEKFFDSYKIFSALFPPGESRNAYENTIMALYKKNPTMLSNDKINAIDKLDNLDIPILDPDNPLSIDFAISIEKYFNSHSDNINEFFGLIFGFQLPKNISFVIRKSYTNATYANMLTANPIIIGLSLNSGFNLPKKTSIILHEILHALIKINNKINYTTNLQGSANLFEEALIDYFAPYGILTEKLGLTEQKEIDIYCMDAIRYRPKSKEISQELLPVIKSYYQSKFEQTIWGYLSDTKFKDFITR